MNRVVLALILRSTKKMVSYILELYHGIFQRFSINFTMWTVNSDTNFVGKVNQRLQTLMCRHLFASQFIPMYNDIKNHGCKKCYKHLLSAAFPD